METSTTEQPTIPPVEEHLDRLLAYEPSIFPVISLYLNLQADNHGRDQFEQFLNKELNGRARTYPVGTPERESLDEDVAKIRAFLEKDLEASANGMALFACHAADLFEVIQLNAPIEEHRLYIYNQPHLYHLARMADEYPRFAAVLSNSNQARIFVFGLGQVIESASIKGEKKNRVKVGGWSQARYQRRLENAHQSHAKEVADALDRIVREDQVQQIVLSGDTQFLNLLQEEMPNHLLERVVDSVKLELNASDQSVWEATMERMRNQDTKTDAEKAERLIAEYRGRGLACAGFKRTLQALANGQVDELLISTSFAEEHEEEEMIEARLAPDVPDASGETDSEKPRSVSLPDLLVTKAKQTDATVSFIQDPKLLEPVRGVGAFLRWR